MIIQESEENHSCDNEEAAPQETEKPVEEEKQEPEPEEEPKPVAEPAEEAVESEPLATTGDLLVFALCSLNNLPFSSVSASLKPDGIATILLAELGCRSKPLDCRP